MKLSNQGSESDLRGQLTTLVAVCDVSTPGDRTGAGFAARTLVYSSADFNLSRLDSVATIVAAIPTIGKFDSMPPGDSEYCAVSISPSLDAESGSLEVMGSSYVAAVI